MAELHRKFAFTSNALQDDAFTVAGFSGREGLSELYQFHISLLSENDSLDLESVLTAPATLTIKSNEGDIPIHGILESMEQSRKVDTYTFYSAVLRPKLWWLTLTQHNQIFLNKTPPQFLRDVLKDGGLHPDIDFEFKLSKEYPEWEYVCQYNESHFNFISHWLERYGISYYFDQSEGTDKIVFTDTKMAHGPMPQGRVFSYYQPSGLEATRREEIVNHFICSQRALPRTVKLKDYNYEHPGLSLEADADVSPKGRGELYIYEEHFRTIAEGKDLAKIRAEEQLCQQKNFSGTSTVPCLRPGYTFELQRHYRGDFNANYLTTAVEHEGRQEAYLRSGLGVSIESSDQSVSYRNSFTAIPADTQFRPQRITEKSRFYGSMNAKVDAAGSGKYAELDEQGRYKVILPFDLSGRHNGKASCRLRMIQPYAGSDFGLHFPLHKGCEVVLNFINGNPDRPVIAGAVPNPEHPSQVTETSQTMSKLTTSGGNKLHIEDRQGTQRMLMQSPTANTWMRLGAPNDPPSGEHPDSDKKPPSGAKDKAQNASENAQDKSDKEKEGAAIYTSKLLDVKVGKKFELVLGHSSDTTLGAHEKTIVGNSLDVKVALAEAFSMSASLQAEFGPKTSFGPEATEMRTAKTRLHTQLTRLTEDQTDLSETVTQLQDEISILNESCNHLAQENSALYQDYNKLAQANEELVQETSRLSQENTELSESVQRLAQMEDSMAEMQNQLTEQSTKIAENTTDINSAYEQLCETNSALSTQSDVIAGMYTII